MLGVATVGGYVHGWFFSSFFPQNFCNKLLLCTNCITIALFLCCYMCFTALQFVLSLEANLSKRREFSWLYWVLCALSSLKRKSESRAICLLIIIGVTHLIWLLVLTSSVVDLPFWYFLSADKRTTVLLHPFVKHLLLTQGFTKTLSNRFANNPARRW